MLLTVRWCSMVFRKEKTHAELVGRPNIMVHIAKRLDPLSSSKSVIGTCPCLTPTICSFPCSYIVRCAFKYSELILRSYILNDILGSRIAFKSFFQQYWNHIDESIPTVYLTDLRRKNARHHAMKQPAKRYCEILKKTETTLNFSTDM